MSIVQCHVGRIPAYCMQGLAGPELVKKVRTKGRNAVKIVKSEILSTIRLRQDYGGQESETNPNSINLNVHNEIAASAFGLLAMTRTVLVMGETKHFYRRPR